jgi:outer membrane lipoprotein carrier protein
VENDVILPAYLPPTASLLPRFPFSQRHFLSVGCAAFFVSIALTLPLAASGFDLEQALKGIEKRYNHAQTLQVSFYQTYGAQGGARRSESGQLFLLKPGRMLWEYAEPKGKFFLSDGKYLYLYNPTANRVERTKAKTSEDMRAPLAFLLGKLNFHKEFRDFQVRHDKDGDWIDAAANSADMPYAKVGFLVGADYQILRVKVTGQDQSVMEFAFSQEKVNPKLDGKMFQFKKPAGAEVVEGAEQGQTS